MADTYLPNIVGQFQQGQQVGAEQRQQREQAQRQSRLSELAQLAYTSQGDTRRGYIGQAYGEDPQFAAGLSGQLGKDDESARNELLGAAKLFVSAPEEARPRLLESLRPRFEAYGIDVPDYSPEAAPEFLRNAQAFIAAYGGGGQSDVKVVGNALVDSSGNVLYEAPYRNLTEQGLIEYIPGQGAREITLGAAQAPAQAATQPPEVTNLQGERGRYSIGADGQPVFIASTTEPNVAQAIQSNAGGFDTQAAVEAPPQYLPPTGQRILPRGAGADAERLRLAQEANARATEAAQRANEAAARAQREAEIRQRFGTIPAGFRVNAAGDALEAVPGGPKPAGSAATEGERKAATLLKRLEGSLSQLDTAVKESPSASRPNLTAEIVRGLPLIGESAANTINPQERQRVEAAQLDILDAALTLGTGAAYTKEQLEGYRKSYFPQIGDDQATINDKTARLQNVIEAAKIAAGRAAPQASGGGGGPAPAPAAPAAQRARNPQTGQVIELRNGQWVPVDG